MKKVIEAFINEEKFPLKGKADSYWSTITLVPKRGCKGISKSLYKYIRNIRVDTKLIDVESPKDLEVESGKLLVTYDVPYIEIEYIDADDKFIEKSFNDLGWKVVGMWDGYN